MYLGRAESLINFWAEDARRGDHASARPMSAKEIAAEFGGRVLKGAPRGR